MKKEILKLIEAEVEKIIKEYEPGEEEKSPPNRKLEALINFFKQEMASAGLLGDPEDLVDLAVLRLRSGGKRRPMGWIQTPDPTFGRTMKNEKQQIKNRIETLASIQNSMLADSYPSKEKGAPPKLNMFYQDKGGWKLTKEQAKELIAQLMPKLINEQNPVKAFNKFHKEELQKFWDIRKQLIVHKDVKDAVKEIKENKVATEEDKANARLQIYRIVSAVSLDTIIRQLASHDWLLSDDRIFQKKGFEVDTSILYYGEVSRQVEKVLKDFNQHYSNEEPEEPANDLDDETDKEEDYTGIFGKPMGSSMPMESLQPPIFLLEEMTKTEIKDLVKDEIKNNLEKMVRDELEKMLKDNRQVKNQIGDLSKEILKMLYKDLSIHHGYVIDRVKF